MPETPKDAAEQFSAVILPFSVGQLAQATDVSKETAKCWKKGRAFPSGLNLMQLVTEFPAVRAWANYKTGNAFESPQSLSIQFDTLERVIASNTAEGRAMRARLMQIAAETGDRT